MEIRTATINDIDQIAALFTEQFDIQAALQPYLMQRGTQDRQFIENTIADDDSQLFVAEEAGKIVGFVSVFEKKSNDFSFMVQRKYAYLMDIIVTKKQQKKGIAAQLMNEVKQWAIDRKLDYIKLSVAANNNAVDFYIKSGYEEIGKTMIHRL